MDAKKLITYPLYVKITLLVRLKGILFPQSSTFLILDAE